MQTKLLLSTTLIGIVLEQICVVGTLTTILY